MANQMNADSREASSASSPELQKNTPSSWLQVTYETLPWHRSADEYTYISKTARRKISSTYEAAIPARIADAPIILPSELVARADALLVSLARFDVEQSTKGYSLPALLLRSESAASSQIEHLTSSVRNVALAELTGAAPHNALAIAGNIAAMRTALTLSDLSSVSDILEIHRALMEPTGEAFGGQLRQEQVWVGGTPYSPHGALFVPPRYELIESCLEDLLLFATRNDVNPLVRAAIVHAQFETIHPFIDGNGRTGRTLMHNLLRQERVLTQLAMPLSAGLLHDIDKYMQALVRYQQGEPEYIVTQVFDALELALALSANLMKRFDGVFADWSNRLDLRKTASIHRLPQLLAQQPVVNAAYVAESLEITPRAARDLIDKACEVQILSRIGTGERNVCYQASELIALLEEASDTAGIRRILASF